MHIRSLEKNNSAEMKCLHQIQQAAYLVEARLLGIEGYAFFPLKETFKELQQSTDEVVVCCEPDSIIGAIFLEKTESSILISKLVVDPQFFRRGIAKALVTYCLNLYPKQDFQVSTGAANHPAIHLYQTFGFKILKTEVVEPNLELVKLQRRSDG